MVELSCILNNFQVEYLASMMVQLTTKWQVTLSATELGI